MDFRFVVFFLFIILFSCSSHQEKGKQITVFCAASLSPVMNELKNDWAKDHQEKLVFNFASSGTLARQIENGAQADVFLSANREWLDYLLEVTALKKHPKSMASNRLVVVAPLDLHMDSTSFDDLIRKLSLHKNHIAMGNPSHVPLGKYTKQTLEKFKLYKNLEAHLMMTKDARSALRLVELGEAEIGFVYQSDAMSSGKVKSIAQVPIESHDPIIYQVISLKDDPIISNLIDFISSPASQIIWKKHGFFIDPQKED